MRLVWAGSFASTFEGLFAIRKTSNGETVGEERIKTAWVTSNFFRVLRVEMERGPGFRSDDDSRGAAEPVVVLSHGSWRRRFGADPDIIGRTIRLEGLPFTIVGVTRPSFTGTSPERVDLWIPFSSVTALRPNDGWVRGSSSSQERSSFKVRRRKLIHGRLYG